MWKNKHVIIALLVTPVLAIIAWFAVDRMVAEEPQAAVAGGAYELVAKPNCRYASGECELVNNDFRLALALSDGIMTLNASHALDSVQLAKGDTAGTYGVPQMLDGAGQSWQLAFSDASADGSIRVLASAGGASYYAETSLAFIGDAD
ncbi:MAG: hypothetical protein AAFY69_06915 [Pseudomonadota bacterium]